MCLPSSVQAMAQLCRACIVIIPNHHTTPAIPWGQNEASQSTSKIYQMEESTTALDFGT